MRIFAIFRIALRALFRNKMRATLTMLGIIFGVGAVITTVSLGEGAKAMVEAQIASMGQNVIQIMSGNFNRGGVSAGFGSASTLTVEDMEAIGREVQGVVAVSPFVRTSGQLIAGSLNTSVGVNGISPEYFDIRSWPIQEGTCFTDADVRGATKVAVIGATTAETLFGSESPVGQVVRVRNVPFKIVGMLARKGISGNDDQDDILFVPYTSAMKRLMNTPSIRSITAQAVSMDQIASIQERIAELLRERHRIGEGRDDDFTIRTQQEIQQRATESSQTMRYLLAGVAAVSLVVGGIGIMNIMLVSVTERTREIGIRMAVGARAHDVMMQFLIEAITLSTIGGGIGVLAGLGTSRLLTTLNGWPTLTSFDWVIGACAFSAIVGIVFGFYPARKASQLDPIEALRYE
jgi:putative ABC transport system permease protein